MALLSLDATNQTVDLEIGFSVPIAGSDLPHHSLINAISGAIFMMYWTGEGDTTHPENGLGLYWFNGEMNRIDVNGELVHER